MKPFDLQAALAGAPVQTRDRRPVKVAGFDSEAEDGYQILGWIEGMAYGWFVDGNRTRFEDSGADLFMVPQKQEGWIVIVNTPYGRETLSTVYFSEEAAGMAAAMSNGYDQKIIRIEWEE